MGDTRWGGGPSILYPTVSHRPGSCHRRRSSIGDNCAPSLERRRRRHRHRRHYDTIDECVAKGMNLPTSLVERRKRRASVYCTREYFYFICVIESIYLANLTLKMMMAYNDGDIVAKIKLGILSHIDTRNRFSCLSGSDNEDDNRQLLVYIMERYANMRGTYFAKHLKGNSGDQLKKLPAARQRERKLLTRLFMQKHRWNWMEIRSSTTTHPSAKLFGRRLQSASSNWQINRIVVITSKEKLLKSLIPLPDSLRFYVPH
jgi:hypothetical protein